ncbi:MAG: hypothetical protein JWO03_530 [Bacteroidetes bacterium]|nr:hypothetical protein [Bacteroidota bacterium]
MAKPQPKPASKETTRPKPKPKPASMGWPFLKFLIAREQWIDWALMGGLFIAILIFLKLYYPYPETETDSGNYVLSAITGKINGYRPYGYSAFLKFFSGFSADVRFVVTWQWFITFISAVSFLFTIKFIFRGLPRIAFYLLCLITILNPSVIFMDSYMMSDSLFVSLTLLFLTTLIWIIYNGSYFAIAANILLLWWCMDTRYIGLFYPLFSAAALAWAFWQRFKWVAIAGAIVPVLMLLFYRSSATDKMKEEFGVETFSAFGGWQKANNGVAVLPYVKVDTSLITDPQVKVIHQLVRQFPDSFFKTEDIIATSFMWTRNYPGKLCLSQYIQQTRTPYLQAWVYMSTQMEIYGDFLQSHYRSEYIKHYIVPNFKNVFKVYDISEYDTFKVDQNMKGLFTVDKDVYAYKKKVFKPLTGIRQLCDTIAWIVLIISFIAGLIMLRKLNWTKEQKLVVAALVLFIGAFCGASTIAAPINNFRYMMPVLYAQLTIPVLIISGIIAGLKKKTEE